MNYYAIEKTSSALTHFGILGMKWGVRRYQNKDGSLTTEGKARYLTNGGRLTAEGSSLQKKLADTAYSFPKAVVNDDLAKSLKIEKGDNYDIIKKGASFDRIAGEGDKIDEKRKYVSITPSDRANYSADYEFLPIVGKPHKFTYEAIKDLKVAKPDQVVNHLINKYGDTKVSDLSIDSFSNYSGYNVNKCLADYGSITIRELHASADTLERASRGMLDVKSIGNMKWISDRSKFLNDAYESFIHQKLIGVDEKASKQIIQDFKNKGYDAMVDYEDWSGGEYQYPLILLDPKSQIKETSKKKLWE